MKDGKISLVLAFVAAVLAATVWGAIVQTQYNLAGLSSIGADISSGLRLRTTAADIFSGFSPTYAGYIAAPSLLVAFVVASFVARGAQRTSRLAWFGAAGGVALLLGIPVVNYLSPVALLVGATRDLSCLVLMALGGVFAGLLFAAMLQRVDPLRRAHRTPMEASVAH